MELFERVKALVQNDEKVGFSLPERIGVNAHTMKGYFSKKRQHNLFPLLDKIQAIHPEISRNWLWFGEGLMLAASDDLDNEHEQKLLDELSELRQKLIGLEEILRLKDELIATQKQALQSKEDSLELYRKFYTAEAPTPQKPAGAAGSLTGAARSTPKRIKDTP